MNLGEFGVLLITLFAVGAVAYSEYDSRKRRKVK